MLTLSQVMPAHGFGVPDGQWELVDWQRKPDPDRPSDQSFRTWRHSRSAISRRRCALALGDDMSQPNCASKVWRFATEKKQRSSSSPASRTGVAYST